MHTKALLYGFASALSALALFFVVSFFIDANQVEIPYELLQKEAPQVETPPERDRKNWIAALKRDKEEDFYYPVTEISMRFDMVDSVSMAYKNRLRHFKLHTQKLNNYHYFCLKQVLDQSHIRHKIERFDDEIGVILYSHNEKILNSVVEELKKYGIQSSVKEIKRN